MLAERNIIERDRCELRFNSSTEGKLEPHVDHQGGIWEPWGHMVERSTSSDYSIVKLKQNDNISVLHMLHLVTRYYEYVT